MKYKCDMVRDLMPLCLDQASSEDSKKVVLEHMAECEVCVSYYELMSKELGKEEGEEEPSNKYTELAKRLSKQKKMKRLISYISIVLFVALCFNYAVGYRMTSQKAADISGRLNYKSKVIGSYKWENYMFYFYDSDSCYDVVLAERTWHGWKSIETSLSWPKWYLDSESRIDGVEMVGAMHFVSYDHGIQVFPFISWDENVKKVEATFFDETKSIEVETGEFTLLTFEDSKGHIGNVDKSATAYDSDGNVIYTLEDERGYWVWKEVTNHEENNAE